MNVSRVLVGIAAVAGIAAGLLYQRATDRIDVVVAAADLEPGRLIAQSDVEIRALPPDALPPGVISETSRVAGRFTRSRVWKGQLVVADALALAPASFDGGIALPAGYRAISVPVGAAEAIGGTVRPGSRVDVISVPTRALAPEGRPTELLAEAALVIDVRGEQGGPFEPRAQPRQGAAGIRERLGSVVLAVTPQAELWIAERLPSSTFVLALVRP